MGKENLIQKKEYQLNLEIKSDIDYMPKYMLRADLAISSAGRTISELISIGVPTICLCQNEKEMTHTHASQQFGVLNLGLGSLLNTESIADHVKLLINSPNLRKLMKERAVINGKNRSNSKIINKIIMYLDKTTQQ